MRLHRLAWAHRIPVGGGQPNIDDKFVCIGYNFHYAFAGAYHAAKGGMGEVQHCARLGRGDHGAGKAILLGSVELDEIMALSDRIAVMFDGQIMGERLPSETDETELGLMMAGISEGRKVAHG